MRSENPHSKGRPPGPDPEGKNASQTAAGEGAPANVRNEARYTCGTLEYTKAGIFFLFSWMIWGNLCFNLFESAGEPGILSLHLPSVLYLSRGAVYAAIL